MYTTFVAITQPFIEATLSKNIKRVLALIIFYETREDKIAYTVLIFAIYTIIIFGCIYYLAFQ